MSDRGASGLLGRAAVQELLNSVLRQATADQTEAVLTYEQRALTRVAGNYIHQNVLEETPTLTVRSVFGTRVGQASIERIDAEGVARVVEQAEAIARLAPENPQFPGLPAPGGTPREATYSVATMEASPERRSDAMETVCRLAREAGLEASGSYMTLGEEIGVANAHGVFAYTPRSLARLVVVATGETGSGYADEQALDMDALNVEAIARRAVEIGQRAQQPVTVSPGEYTVILQPKAVSDIATFLALLGFNGRAVYEKRSFVAGKEGEQVLDAAVTIRDDGDDPSGLPLPFDFEGMPRRPLALIERGVARDIALDSYYAALLGRTTTGHALPPTARFNAGPIPVNLFVEPGTATVEEMIRSTERGLLVTHFHYTRVVHPLHAIITGMTRDGTFLIENGEIARPVKNLRFTQSYVEALRNVQAIGRETTLTGEWVTTRVPALKIGAFAFTGVTQ